VFEANSVAPAGDATSIRILTYNLQQGVSDAQNKNYDGQLEILSEIDADIIGLQETSKIAGNSDVIRYFANRLNLYSYFGPKGVTGTTGVALLSKYPIENARTIYHYSEDIDRKQTATIEAEITVGSRTFTVYVTHTSGRTSAKVILQNDVLNAASGKSNVIFMGDFNFIPFTEPYNITTAELVDSWWVRWPTGANGQGEDNSREIDHIFLSPGTTVTDCQYITDPQSDHPAYWADIQW
jgi:endonuclease/exonuclease/phosphatase family metal-dependent hydrolase